MGNQLLSISLTLMSTAAVCGAQINQPPEQPVNHPNPPIYQVTVVERTVKAVNYQYRGLPTPIGFRGTVLLPDAKGEAMVQSKAGRTDIDAKFEHIPEAQRFGAEYLTYVLWAVTPDGRAKNLGEVLANASDKAGLHVTTNLQAFGMIVTAEPYAAVRQPSDVVVMENQIRPDTTGTIEQINAKYELLPRGHYTYQVPAAEAAEQSNARKLPMDRYESLLEVYQAQNAVQIAQSLGAAQYAPDTFEKAENEFHNAQQLYDSHAGRSDVVTAAREAAQTAEDARVIAERHKQENEVAAARARVERERDQLLQAQAEARQAQIQASADRAQTEQQPATTPMAAPPPPPPAAAAAPAPPQNNESQQRAALRTSLLQQLSADYLPVRDTPRGLVITVPDQDFQGDRLNSQVDGAVRGIAFVVEHHPGLAILVEGNSDSADQDQMASERAQAVRAALLSSGVPPQWVLARGLGNSRPLVSNATAEGRRQNRRVEITIYGTPIGTLASWDRSYSLAPRQ
jgi:outer membrane protein OmpA-like peptidoglycan-associated protein